MNKESKPLSGLKEHYDYQPSKVHRYTQAKKHQIIQDYLQSGKSKAAIWREHTGQEQEHGQILRWMRKLGYVEDDNSFKNSTFSDSVIPNNMSKSQKDSQETSTAEDFEKLQLKKKIAELEKQLEEAQLKAIAFSTMVDIAEEEFHIPIRKKYNTKPLKK